MDPRTLDGASGNAGIPNGSGYELDGIVDAADIAGSDGTGSDGTGSNRDGDSGSDNAAAAGTQDSAGVRGSVRQRQPTPLESILGVPGAAVPAGPRGGRGGGGKKSGAKLDDKQAGMITNLFVMLFQGLAVQTFGPEAAFNAAELGMIQPAMSRLIARMPSRQAALIQGWMDPMLLAAGLSMWGFRMYKLSSRPAEALANNQTPRIEPAAQPQNRRTSAEPSASAQPSGVRGNIVAPMPEDILQHIGD